jgi:hypothetical protein
MDTSTLVRLFASFPEMRALMRCANRLGVTIGLRGGLIRNVLLAEGTVSGRYDSLYDFVDPFGDIDLVVTDDIKQSILARALFAEVPFADCHVWDLQTVDAGETAARREGSVAADRLVLWFDPEDGGKGNLRLGATDSDVIEILRGPARPTISLNFRTELRPIQISRFIKFARTQMQIESPARPLIEPLAQFANQFRRLFHSRRSPLSPRTRLQTEIELAQLLMTAPDWRQVSAFVGQLREILLGDWLPEVSTLRQMLTTVDSRREMRVGSAVYKSWAQAPLMVEFVTAEVEDNRPGDSNRSRIPWTRLQLVNRSDGTCCPYSDFEDGIAVVAWRNTGSEATRQDQLLHEEEYGLVAHPVAPTQSLTDVLSRNRRIPMLGYVRKGRSIVMRLDPAYLKLITGGKFSTFMVGLVSVLTSGGINTPETEPPKALAPEGEAKKPSVKSPVWKLPGFEETKDEEEKRRGPTPVTA